MLHRGPALAGRLPFTVRFIEPVVARSQGLRALAMKTSVFRRHQGCALPESVAKQKGLNSSAPDRI